MNTIRAFLAFAILLILAACGDSSLLLQIDPADGVSIRSLPDGSVVSDGENIPIEIDYDEDFVNPVSVEVRLLDASGWELNLVTIPIESHEDLPDAFGLPDIIDGRYVLEVSLYDADGIVSQESVDFFRSDTQYDLRTISTYPAVIVPGGAGLAIADISVTDGTDAYVRWKFAGEVFYQGYLSEGADWVEFGAPDEPGVYTMLFELFPAGPAPGDDFEFDSPYGLETQTFVSSEQQDSRTEFGPSASYYSLFHFRGETLDYSDLGETRTVTAIGSPNLMIDGSVFGYEIKPGNGFVIDDFILPPGENSQSIGPFSISIRGTFSPNGAAGSLLSVASPDQEHPTLTLGVNGEGNVVAAFGEMAATVPADLLFDESPRTCTVSIVPESEGCWFAWYVDGFEIARFFRRGRIPSYAEFGTTTIFGTNGITGILDEFGVYYQDSSGNPSPDPDVYARAMARVHGSKLVYADGFDGNMPPASTYIQGSAEVVGGNLVIEAGSTAVLPVGLELSDRYTLSLELSGEGSVALFRHNTSEVVVSVYTDGTVQWRGGTGTFDPPLSELVIERENGHLLLSTDQIASAVSVPLFDVSIVDVGFAAAQSPQSELRIDWVLFLKSPILVKGEQDRVAVSMVGAVDVAGE